MKTITKLFVSSFVAFTILVTFNVNSFAKTTKALKGDEAIPFRGITYSAKYVDNNSGSFRLTKETLSLRGDDATPHRGSTKYRVDNSEFVLRLNTGLATADVVEGDARPFTEEKKRNAVMNIVNGLMRFFTVDVYENIYDNGFPETDPIYFQPYKNKNL